MVAACILAEMLSFHSGAMEKSSCKSAWAEEAQDSDETLLRDTGTFLGKSCLRCGEKRPEASTEDLAEVGKTPCRGEHEHTSFAAICCVALDGIREPKQATTAFLLWCRLK